MNKVELGVRVDAVIAMAVAMVEDIVGGVRSVGQLTNPKLMSRNQISPDVAIICVNLKPFFIIIY